MSQDTHVASSGMQQLLQGPLKHIKTAALAAALVPLATVAPVEAQSMACPSAGTRVCGLVWNDLDKNGVQDTGEPAIVNQAITLSWLGGTATIQTDAYGAYGYNFSHFQTAEYAFRSGDYQVAIPVPAGWAASPKDVGDDSWDSDGDFLATESISRVTFTLGDTDDGMALDLDFGIFLNQQVNDPGTGTPGYWKNHPAAWPVSSIVIGGVQYSRDDAVALLGNNGTDKRFTLFDSLTSAKLNVLIGNTSSCIADEIEDADGWLTERSDLNNTDLRVKASSPAWRMASPWHKKMDDYNNGMLCAPHRN